ncbi:transporter substrate-binding domain-containing protein [Paenibacillus albiflavus]|uniref:Transporter substrate-binding domain-containing protein n=1 Tax=Paenibacillus albiflavus TaxID=2545760 RepID=A0A4R4E686_9BACL|nr:transporter substrate-binding domain-containing protein [Paenibacillus albiflavus]TCZ73551.1 transporter substrate-binding domain-containing protein [Paenibacillus albiflavus]
MKRIWSMAIVICLVLVVAACGNTDKQASGGSAKKYKFGTDATWAPQEYMENGKIVGFDVDFLEAVMKEAKLDYELSNVEWNSFLAEVQEGKKLDGGISSVTINDERIKSYDFSIPYFESTNMIITKQDGIKTALDLKDKKIGVQNATTGQTVIEDLFGKELKGLNKYENITMAFMELDNGGIDAVVADNMIVNEYLKNNPNKQYKALYDKTNFASEFYGILLPKGSELKAKLDPAVKAVLENGKYAEIYKKWYGSEPDVKVLLDKK